MQKELLLDIRILIDQCAGPDRARRVVGYHWVRHGLLEAKVARPILEKNPTYLAPDTTILDAEFGFTVHDIGKMRSVSNPGIWDTAFSLFTPEDASQTMAHVTEGLNILHEVERQGFFVPRAAFEIVAYHHEYLNGSGIFGMTARNLTPLSRLAAIIDNLVSRCEDREHRYRQPAQSFLQAFTEVSTMGDFDRNILRAVWEVYAGNPHIGEVGVEWIVHDGSKK